MRPELTPELKSKFCALYYGQRVLFHEKGSSLGSYAESHWNSNEDWYLQLRPVSSITDEEAEIVLLIFDESGSYDDKYGFDKVGFLEFLEAIWTEPAGGFINGYTATEYSTFVDYLRSKSFAMPFMGYSVEDLVEAGWARLVAEEVAQS